MDVGEDAANSLINALRAEMGVCVRHRHRPIVTLTYAQSLDGSIATACNVRTGLSGAGSMRMTHGLRAVHDAILVGVNTVIADDPKLNVRLCEGMNPQPVVLDSNLRIPSSCALFVHENCIPPIVITSEDADRERQRELETRGAKVLRCKTDSFGHLDLGAALAKLCRFKYVLRRFHSSPQKKTTTTYMHLSLSLLLSFSSSRPPSSLHLIEYSPTTLSPRHTHNRKRTLMVEGGGSVITSFLHTRNVDNVIITIAPTFLGGYPSVTPNQPLINSAGQFPQLHHLHSIRIENDVILTGKLC